jgi:hypothetical protein
MRVRDLILPEDKVFYSLFADMADIINKAAATLNEITHELPMGTEKAHKVHQLEHQGDEITRQIYEKLNESLITPLEPEEIARFAPALDDVIDRIDRGHPADLHLWPYRTTRNAPGIFLCHPSCNGRNQ